MNNPYNSPQSRIVDTAAQANIEEVAGGQKLVIYAILVYFFGAVLRVAIGPLALVAFLASVVMAILGIVKLGTGLGYSTVTKVLLSLAMFIPLIGLIVMLVLNSKATNRLRAAGYSVGLLGARR